MTDYIENMIEANRLLKAAEYAAMQRDYSSAYSALKLAEHHNNKMMDWFDDAIRNPPTPFG